MFIGAGTTVNVATVLIGSAAGLVVGHRLGARTRELITDALGLVTLLIAAQSAMSVGDGVLQHAVGSNAPVLIVLGALLIGGMLGSWWRLEQRLESFGGWLQSRLARPTAQADAGPTSARERFIEGFVTSSLVFCVGPLTILGALQDGLGDGASQLYLKACLDGFAALAFAASLGVGVMASAVSVALVQGALTVLAVALGSFMPDAQLSAVTAAGGLILVGVGLRLLNIRQIAVADLLPALIVAPLLTQLVSAVR